MSTNVVSQKEIEKAIVRTNECIRLLMTTGLTEKDKQQVIDDPEFRNELVEFWQSKTKLVTVEITEPTSLLDLREKYGTSSKGFFGNDWWLDRDFAKEKIQPGKYVVNFEKQLTNKTFQEQQDALPEGWEMPHPAILAAAYFQHLEETGQRLLDGWWSRTSKKTSGDKYVNLISDSEGLLVYNFWDNSRHLPLGVAPYQKLS